METEFLNYIIQQTPTIAIMGYFLHYFIKRYERADLDKSELAQDVIKLTILVEKRLTDGKEIDSEMIRLLNEIRDYVKDSYGIRFKQK